MVSSIPLVISNFCTTKNLFKYKYTKISASSLGNTVLDDQNRSKIYLFR